MNNKQIKNSVLSIVAFMLSAGAVYLLRNFLPRTADAVQTVDSKPLVIALIPEKNSFEQRLRYGQLAHYIEEQLGSAVRIELLPNYSRIYQAFLDGTVDAGFFGSFSYIIAHDRGLVEPVARPVWLNGTSTYRGYIITRKDSGITSLEDMKGKTLALVDKATTAGYLFQLWYFRQRGITNIEQYFSKVRFCGSQDAAAWAVFSREADVGGCKNDIFNALKASNPKFAEEMLVLAESVEVPSNGLAVRKNLEPYLKQRLKAILLDMDKSRAGRKALEEFKAIKFTETTEQDYSSLVKMVQEAGVDLSEYWHDQ